MKKFTGILTTILIILIILLIVFVFLYFNEKNMIAENEKNLKDSEVEIYNLKEENEQVKLELENFKNENSESFEEYKKWEEKNKEIESYL